MKVCSVPDCPEIQRESKCKAHRSQAERARGTSTARGYGSQHRALRAQYQRLMDAGAPFICWRCTKPIDPSAWTLGHCDEDRAKYHGPECPPCDYATAGRAGCPHPSHGPMPHVR